MELWELLRADFVINLLTPLIYIVFGIFAVLVLPRKPNAIMGYRTPMACKNQDTWVYAHKHFGKQAIIFGLVYILLSVERIMQVDKEAYSWVIGVIIAGQVISILLPLFSTEIALRREFDKNGLRKSTGQNAAKTP
ncbi:MAG: SdpI family protein [Defluviitaleaceae bacterium]|nr:SdpI family protein [Defluviitaleaceae bacterium]